MRRIDYIEVFGFQRVKCSDPLKSVETDDAVALLGLDWHLRRRQVVSAVLNSDGLTVYGLLTESDEPLGIHYPELALGVGFGVTKTIARSLEWLGLGTFDRLLNTIEMLCVDDADEVEFFHPLHR